MNHLRSHPEDIPHDLSRIFLNFRFSSSFHSALGRRNGSSFFLPRDRSSQPRKQLFLTRKLRKRQNLLPKRLHSVLYAPLAAAIHCVPAFREDAHEEIAECSASPKEGTFLGFPEKPKFEPSSFLGKRSAQFLARLVAGIYARSFTGSIGREGARR